MSLLGCFGSGRLAFTIVYAPFSNPELPSPATALPMISMFDDVAAPHNKDPNSKTAKKLRNAHFNESLLVFAYLVRSQSLD